MPLELVKRPKSPYWIMRGSIAGSRIEESTQTCDRKRAEEIKAKRESKLFDEKVYGRCSTATFSEAALSYLENGGSNRFTEAIIRHFGTTPLARIDQEAIDLGARKLYPNASAATRNRQFFTPTAAILRHAARLKWCAPLLLRRPKIKEALIRWLKPEEAQRLIAACNPHLRPLVIFMFLPPRWDREFHAARHPPHMGDAALRAEPRSRGADETRRLEVRANGAALYARQCRRA